LLDNAHFIYSALSLPQHELHFFWQPRAKSLLLELEHAISEDGGSKTRATVWENQGISFVFSPQN